ncbi:hypothetical protein [Microbacterium sp. SLBN-111]|uniref:hypothetical protein n=1 Tax=Microbacterium sp. SLBN-111 TaxID=3377733 RepID=UPI003C789899
MYHYRIDQTGAQGTLPPSGGSIGGLANGATYTISVWATSSVQGVSPGAETRSNEAVPFGKPILTFEQVNRQDRAVQFVWTVNANGRPITGTNAPVGGEGRLSWTKDGLQPSESYTLNLSYTNEAGTTSDSRTGQANDPPPTKAWITNISGKSATLNFQSYQAGTYEVRCWAASKYEDRKWDGVAGANYAGAVANVAIPENGSVRIDCPDTHGRLGDDKPFSLEIFSKEWVTGR